MGIDHDVALRPRTIIQKSARGRRPPLEHGLITKVAAHTTPATGVNDPAIGHDGAADDWVRERLRGIFPLKEGLEVKYQGKLQKNEDLNRTLVSYQGNRAEPELRWVKYREGFSAELVKYILDRTCRLPGRILDPFAGSGTTLFAAADLGYETTGIELLPNVAELIEVRRELRSSNRPALAIALREFAKMRSWTGGDAVRPFPHVRITKGAFPEETETEIGRYLDDIDHVKNPLLGRILCLALMGVLEDVSFTRKDGQYLRWDARSGKNPTSRPFNKGAISRLTPALVEKIDEIASDLESSSENSAAGAIDLVRGSCLEVLPRFGERMFDGVVTSPPYCNRYDYTRTYALELALLGVDETALRKLRQSMLTCTVENRDKLQLDDLFGQQLALSAYEACNRQLVLQHVVGYLEDCRRSGLLNNPGIPRMVRNYFRELALVVFGCARVLRANAPFVMVNDNVRYQGVGIPVDLILSDIAEAAGFETECIWVLPRGKGNSSQQMGAHGREELRKSVIVWRRAAV